MWSLSVVRRGALTALAVSAVACARQAEPVSDPVTVLFDDRITEVTQTLAAPNDLWVVPEDLPRVNGFELKPQGACLDELCIPVRQDVDSDLFVTRSGQGWFNATELARVLEQPYAVDHDHRVWSLGQVPIVLSAVARSGMAPDFELPNRDGELVSLLDFRGKKVLIITWASW